MDDAMAHGALKAIRDLLDDGKIPRGTFADDQVRNLVALYNQRGDEIGRLRQALEGIRGIAFQPCKDEMCYRPTLEKMKAANRALSSLERTTEGDNG